jgi:hypothetical protein
MLELIIRGVVSPSPTDRSHALDLIIRWDAGRAGFLLLIQVLLSLAVSIVWIAVLTTRYNMDVQVSVTTGFTLGIYVLAAGKAPSSCASEKQENNMLEGTLLVALTAFFDTMGQ